MGEREEISSILLPNLMGSRLDLFFWLLGNEASVVVFFLHIKEGVGILIGQNCAANIADSVVDQTRRVNELVLVHVSDFRSIACTKETHRLLIKSESEFSCQKPVSDGQIASVARYTDRWTGV